MTDPVLTRSSDGWSITTPSETSDTSHDAYKAPLVEYTHFRHLQPQISGEDLQKKIAAMLGVKDMPRMMLLKALIDTRGQETSSMGVTTVISQNCADFKTFDPTPESLASQEGIGRGEQVTESLENDDNDEAVHQFIDLTHGQCQWPTASLILWMCHHQYSMAEALYNGSDLEYVTTLARNWAKTSANEMVVQLLRSVDELESFEEEDGDAITEKTQQECDSWGMPLSYNIWRPNSSHAPSQVSAYDDMGSVNSEDEQNEKESTIYDFDADQDKELREAYEKLGIGHMSSVDELTLVEALSALGKQVVDPEYSAAYRKIHAHQTDTNCWKSVRIWSIDTDKMLRGMVATVPTLSWDAIAKRLFTTAADCQERSELLDAKDGKEKASVQDDDEPSYPAWECGGCSPISNAETEYHSDGWGHKSFRDNNTDNGDATVYDNHYGCNSDNGSYSSSHGTFSVSYEAVIRYGGDVLHIPIEDYNVSGPEKSAISGSMEKIWEWAGDMAFCKHVGLQEAFDLAYSIENDTKAWRWGY